MASRWPNLLILLGALLHVPVHAEELDLPDEESSLYVETRRESTKLLSTANEHAAAGRWREAVEAYQQLVEFSPDDGAQPVVPLLSDPAVSVPVQRLAGIILLSLAPEAHTIYRDAYDAAARRAFDLAQPQRDSAALERVADRFPVSSWADDALAALGSIAFARGDYVSAIAAWRRLEACPSPSVSLLSARARMCLAYRALGLRAEAEALEGQLQGPWRGGADRAGNGHERRPLPRCPFHAHTGPSPERLAHARR